MNLICDLAMEFGKSNPCHAAASGEFCSTAGGGAALSPAPKDRAQWPEHVKQLVIPPAWTDVRINPNPKAALLVTGKDAAGRSQYVYSKAFIDKQAQAKFSRIQELDVKFDSIKRQNAENLKARDPVVREHAQCAALVMGLGIRPGSTQDTHAKVQAYGATTLLGKHVVEKGGEVRLQFVGKKGVSLDLPVTDRSLAAMLKQRAKAAGTKGDLFPSVDGGSLLRYSHTMDGGGFKTKDFRTLVGTRTAIDQMKTMKPPKTQKEYKTAVMTVAKHVAIKLGNTPTVALQSYISPSVFSAWRSAYGTP